MSLSFTTSDVLTSVSIVVTLGTTIWAIYERFSARAARKELARFRKLLISQQIAWKFADAPTQALHLFRSIRKQDWEASSELSLLLTSNLASLRGAQQSIAGELDLAALDTVLKVLADLNRYLPRSAQIVDEEAISHFVESCNVVLLSVTTLERSISTSAALGGDFDGKLTGSSASDEF